MALDANTPENPKDEERRPGNPIYPMGPALRVPPESVRLTFLELQSPIPTAPVSGDDLPQEAEAPAEQPGLEIRTPLGVSIPVFEGPLDLLLYLIRRDKIDIYDIPIGPITEQYLEMLGLLKVLDLDVAGDFLVMAATLMRIKARMLLPTWPEEDDEEDPRTDLVRQLLEYRKFKEAATRLKVKEEERRLLFGRGFIPEFEAETPVELEPISHFALIEVMKDVLSRVGEDFFYEVELEDVSLEDKIALIIDEIETKGRALFVDLVTRYKRRLHVVVTFMAILELAKLGRIALAQESAFSQIWIYPVVDGRVVTQEPGTEATATETEEPLTPEPTKEENDHERG